MEIKLEIPKYDPKAGFKFNWDKNFQIEVTYESSIVTIKANKSGLISLANHLLNLAQDEIPIGFHLHFDDINSLNEGSIELIIEKQ